MSPLVGLFPLLNELFLYNAVEIRFVRGFFEDFLAGLVPVLSLTNGPFRFALFGCT